MKAKTKGILTGAVFVLLMALLVLLAVFTDSPTTASAATTPKYLVAFNYTYKYNEYTAGGGSNTGHSGNDVYSTSFTSGYRQTTSITAVYLYGSSASGTATMENGGYIQSDSVNVEVTTSGTKISVTIRDSNGNSLGSGKNKASASGLSDGTYTISLSYSNTWTINSRAGANCSFSATITFNIDGQAPTISGASTSATAMKTNKSFTVSATDSVSGLKALYMKTPNNNTFYSVGSSTTVNRGSTNGRYTFYAEDNALNKTSYYYVNFDDTPPTLTCDGASFGSNTNSGFTVKAEDNSGSVTLYRKIDDGSWAATGKSFTADSSSDDATYYFYAQDDFGNKTSEMWVQLGAELSGEFVKSDSDNTVYFTWDRASWTATLDGEAYKKGTWIREEGEHTIKLMSATKSAVYPYTIDHFYVQSLETPTCTHAGYLQFDCVQCGNSYTEYSIEETGHYYVASTIAATCTNGGYTVYTCTRCGDSYTDNYTHPLGHNYEATYMPATCTDYGKTVFTCQVCGSGYYETDGTYPTGHNYTNEVVSAPTCTEDGLRRSTCESCGNTFDTKITANGHNYNITESTSTKGITTRTYTCSVCHHSYKQELGDQYEEVTNYVEYLFEQYEPYMWWVLLASAGVWSIVIGVMIAIATRMRIEKKQRKCL